MIESGLALPSRRAALPDALGQLLAGTWPDPDGGVPIGVPIAAIAIEDSLAGIEADLVVPLSLGRRFAVVSDPTTQRVLGTRVARALASIGTIVTVVLDGEPHADAETVERLRRACAAADSLVAVGSGTINDLCKYAAATDGKPYVVYATAPSMNGYTSMNAAITVAGHKKTLPAVAPRGVFIDLEVFALAPTRMIQAGLGDSLCRTTAQADWLLSHQLLGTDYRRAPFGLLAADEPALLDAPEALVRGDLYSMRSLARTLVLSGLGMTLCGGSYPASQGEHLISHYIDTFAPAPRAPCYHGEQVAVATLTMVRLQEALLDGPAPRVTAPLTTRHDLQRRFGAGIGEECWREFAAKRLTERTAGELTSRIAETWDATRAVLSSVMIPAAKIADVMARAGCPRKPEDVGLTDEFYARAVRDARFLRDRYTFLDLAADSGRPWPDTKRG
jgi:glycerol-1-phosphate dehydrogenase [NAD(P)+]